MEFGAPGRREVNGEELIKAEFTLLVTWSPGNRESAGIKKDPFVQTKYHREIMCLQVTVLITRGEYANAQTEAVK